MGLRSVQSYSGYYFLFILVYILLYFAASKPTIFEEQVVKPHGFKKVTNRTVNRRLNAMDRIIAINTQTPVRRTLRVQTPQLDNARVKRMNVTKFSNGTMVKTNTSEFLNGTDVILQTNIDEKVADDLLEGDIMLNPLEPEDYKLIRLIKEEKKEIAEDRLHKRQAARELKTLWHSRIVPYEIDRSLSTAYYLIMNTIAKFNTKSCVKFSPHRGEKDYVIFRKNDGCSSHIGRMYTQPGPQQISIDDACRQESIIMHEMLHAVGFYHEQSRPDRDRYLKILWENIPDYYKPQFNKYSHGVIDQFGINYNYQSIMQYGRTAFAGNSGDTMQAITDPNMFLGGEQMSLQDIEELNVLYDCQSSKFNSWTSWSRYAPCDEQCFKSRQRYCYGSSKTACGGNPNFYGIETQRIKCLKDECPMRIDGHWGSWSLFGGCTEKCNEGVRVRTRVCDNPKPTNGGKTCPGLNKDSIICIQPRCSLGYYDTDFRDGHLGLLWRNDAYDTPTFDWLIGYGSTATEGTGPSYDHLGYYGYYLYVESSGRARGDNARLYTEYLPSTTGTCFSFYYHMHGPTTGRLSLSMYPKGKRDPLGLFYKIGPQGDKWHFQKVDLISPDNFQLVFEATVADGDYSDIAIDDLFFAAGNCSCQDNFKNCEIWAKRKDCVASYDFMLAHCKKSCNFCDCVDTNPSCEIWMKSCDSTSSYNYMESSCPFTCRRCVCHNNNVKCDKWAKNGYCKKSAKYMRKNCRRSCGICQVPKNVGR